MNKNLLVLVVVTAMGFFAGSSFAHDDWSGHNEGLEKAFKKMAKRYKAMKKADDLDEISEYLSEFETYLKKVVSIDVEAYPDDQAIYDKGIEKLQNEFAKLKVAVANNDASLVELHLKELGKIRKKYHDKLNIGD